MVAAVVVAVLRKITNLVRLIIGKARAGQVELAVLVLLGNPAASSFIIKE